MDTVDVDADCKQSVGRSGANAESDARYASRPTHHAQCPTCGAPISGDETFCPQCMARLPAQPTEATPDAQAPRLRRCRLKWLRRRPWLVGLLVVAVLGLGAGAAIFLKPTRPQEPLREARRLYALHRETEAIAALERVIAQEPGTMDAHLLLGYAHLRLGDYEEAADSFTHALARDPGLSSAQLGLGQAAFYLGWDDVAEDHLSTAVNRMPNSSAAHAYLGVLYYRQDRLTDAQTHLSQALQSDPGNIWARAHLGQTYLQLGNPEAAIPELERALQAAPDADIDHRSVDIRLALARAYAATGQVERAKACFGRVLRQHPANLKALLGYSETLLALERTKEAQTAAESALENTDLTEQARQAAVIAGWLRYRSEHYDEARDWFAAAVVFDPQSAAAHNGLGWAGLRMEDWDAARAAFEEALELQPEGWTGRETPQAGLEACQSASGDQ